MAIPSFFYDGDLKAGNSISLSANESNHAIKARRLKGGQAVNVLNGRGQFAEAVLQEIGRKQVIVELRSCARQAEATPSIHIISAVPKSDRQKFLVDMATQLGVSALMPLDSEYSVVSANTKTLERWDRYTVEACKQSQNAWKPTVDKILNLAKLSDWLPDFQAQGLVFFADGDGVNTLSIQSEAKATNAITVIIGPEGGFSDKEVQLFKQNQLTPIRLGANILRTETAVVAAVSQIKAILND